MSVKVVKQALAHLGLGRKLLRFRQATRFGARVEWRTLQAKRLYLKNILSATPLSCCEGPADCFMLLNEARLWEGLWSLYSFRYRFGPCRVTVLDDGSLKPKSILMLRKVLPGITINDPTEQDVNIQSELHKKKLYRCLGWRKHFVFARKLFDPWMLSATKHIILLDSDCLHFNVPQELFEAFEGPRTVRYISDVQNFSLCADPNHLSKLCGARLPGHFCAGFLYVPRDSLQLSRIEAYLGDDIFTQQLEEKKFSHVAEQTIYAMESAVIGFKILPASYTTCPDVDTIAATVGHYCGGSPERTWFYTKGLPLVQSQLEIGGRLR